MSVLVKATVIFLFILGMFSCRKPFAPAVTTADPGYLVVEGVINSGADSTIIKISRTVPLYSKDRRPETGARVTVESDQNGHYPLTETAKGTYVAVNLNLATTGKYRLHIFTAANNEYVSDYVENKITPPIDSISYKVLNAGVQFYVNTHDASNSTKYYRWEYGEAWTYYSPFQSLIIYKDGGIAGRSLDSNVNYCYKFAVPDNNIFVSSSDKLEQDVIYKYPLGYTAGTSWKFQSEYGLTVKQYALTPDAYKYWQLLKKNTEQLGSIFDAQPATALTNLHAVTNPGEPVIGYISVSTTTLKRIFFTNRDFDFRVVPPPGYNPLACEQKIILLEPANTFSYRLRQAVASGDSLLTTLVIDLQTNQLVGYDYANKICVDCRLEGGTTTKPSYWPF